MRSGTQVIDDQVVLGEDVQLGEFVHICARVVIGDGAVVGDHVTIHEGAVIGAGTVVADGAVIGKRPMLSRQSTASAEPLPGVAIGAGCKIGTHAIVMAGSTLGDDVVVGDGALVRERCQIGAMAVIGRAATVENDTSIGARTRIQTGAYVTAYMTIEEDCFIAPMVVTTNDNFMGRTDQAVKLMRGATIRRGARVGGGAHLLPAIEVGEEAFIATGAVVTRDVPARTVVMGVPAKPSRTVGDDELLSRD